MIPRLSDYDSIGSNYSLRRQPDPRIARRIRLALGNAKTICNVGAGAGSYEPADLEVTAVEPSAVMTDQRRTRARVVQATAEALPFADDTFDAAMTVLSLHHWHDPVAGLREMQRVARRQVVFTFDCERTMDLWLVRDYLPQIVDFERDRTPLLHTILDTLEAHAVETVPIPWNCTDGFLAAYWRRPAEYLKSENRSAISVLVQLPQEIITDGIQRLQRDLEDGSWQRQHADLLHREQLDCGYRLVIAGK